MAHAINGGSSALWMLSGIDGFKQGLPDMAMLNYLTGLTFERGEVMLGKVHEVCNVTCT